MGVSACSYLYGSITVCLYLPPPPAFLHGVTVGKGAEEHFQFPSQPAARRHGRKTSHRTWCSAWTLIAFKTVSNIVCFSPNQNKFGSVTSKLDSSFV
jgi:hypothetical protein